MNPKKKLARDAAQQLISGHTTLLVVWALKHAGIFEAMAKTTAGLEPRTFAARTNMSSETLVALLNYLAHQGVVTFADNHFTLTPTGQALLELEGGVLEHFHAYQPVMQVLEHLLAKLKSYGHGVFRKNDALLVAQASRYKAEVYPALERAVLKSNATHVLDLACGTGEFLIRLAGKSKKVVGVGLCAEGAVVRQANDLIAEAGLEKRLIVVAANPVESLADTRRTFERAGISQQLWAKFDCLVGCNAFTDYLPHEREQVAAALAQLPKSFPNVQVLLTEPTAGLRLERNYYAAELELVLRLSHSELLADEQWRALLTGAGLTPQAEEPLQTDGLLLFACRTPARAATAERLATRKTPAAK